MPFTDRPAQLSPLSKFLGKTLQSVVQTMRGIKAFVTLLFDESGNLLEPVWELSNSLVDSHAFEAAVVAMKATPEVAALLAERYVTPPHDLEALVRYPKNSLGYAYASSLKQAGFQPLEAALRASRNTDGTAIASDIH
ncbi:MAG: hypothetical protein KME13_16950 [Myxacorys californica WJT36-NPBG1]|jgi:ubiquinone biosynthesis protein Coq4|nr:hypothetical protein [Myxacorys californica WJT36-NPBG1]